MISSRAYLVSLLTIAASACFDPGHDHEPHRHAPRDMPAELPRMKSKLLDYRQHAVTDQLPDRYLAVTGPRRNGTTADRTEGAAAHRDWR
jgi:hypothetical protein